MSQAHLQALSFKEENLENLY